MKETNEHTSTEDESLAHCADCESLSPEVLAEIEAHERKVREANERMRELETAGWQRGSDGGLFDPCDPDVNAWMNPYSGEILLSPKLVDRIKASLLPKSGA